MSPTGDTRQQIRLLAGIAEMVERQEFVSNMLTCKNDMQVKEYMLHKDRFLNLKLHASHPSGGLIGLNLKDLRFPQGVLIALVMRGNNVFAPDGNTYLHANDVLTIIGDEAGIKKLHEKYGLQKSVEDARQ
ncbi:MAG: hypothetical protein HC896_15850 [Bacteroidales bacterium]|nr:hypothetical protein [Bacteroidales bacterium]